MKLEKDNEMKLYHTSPNLINKIDKFGTFKDCLFFSNEIYYMSNRNIFVYSLDASNLKFIEASQLYDIDIINQIICYFDSKIDEETAECLLDASKSIWNLDTNIIDSDFVNEADYFLQAMRGECAKKMGFDGCKDFDEQGTVYIIPMFDKENKLHLEKV